MLLFHNDTCESPLVLTKNKLWILEMGVLNINGVSNNESFKHLFEMQTLKSQIFVHMLWRDVWKCSPTHIQNFWRYFLRPWIRVVSHSKRAFFTSRKFQTLGPPFVPIGKQQQFGRKLKILFATQVTFRLEWVVGVWAASCSSYSQRSL